MAAKWWELRGQDKKSVAIQRLTQVIHLRRSTQSPSPILISVSAFVSVPLSLIAQSIIFCLHGPILRFSPSSISTSRPPLIKIMDQTNLTDLTDRTRTRDWSAMCDTPIWFAFYHLGDELVPFFLPLSDHFPSISTLTPTPSPLPLRAPGSGVLFEPHLSRESWYI